MNLSLVIPNIIDPALGYLPPQMESKQAKAMLIAIGLQESKFEHRRQIGGPARGYWQFEQGGGCHGVLTHPATREPIRLVLGMLDYGPEYTAADCYYAITHNDILAACFARLLLWTLPGPLPIADEFDESWDQYLSAWRPGKPHRQTWNGYYALAWDTVEMNEAT